ncbi:MAG: RNA-binding S4 domain-containing protein [Candidatus Caldatribacteriota bacterium]|nr:RNA-binding S4 domain-containing protein [Candidatus Caldatribacteriota bacterium]
MANWPIDKHMRLDKFLKVSRLIKRRTEAKKACLAKCIRINNRIAKAGDEVKIGDEIEINFTNKILQAKALDVPLKNIPAEKASSLYEVIKEIKKEED